MFSHPESKDKRIGGDTSRILHDAPTRRPMLVQDYLPHYVDVDVKPSGANW